MAENVLNSDAVELIKDYRDKKNLTNKELAELLGTNETSLSRWLNLRHKISPAWKELILQKLLVK